MLASVPSFEKPTWLCAFPDLSQVTDDAGQAALRAAARTSVSAGTKIVRRGDPCQAFALLTRGTVRVCEVDETGREIVLYRVQPGELCVLTFSNLLAGGRYSAEAVAETDVEVVSIPIAPFQHALAHSDTFRNFVLSTFARRLSELLTLVEQVAFQRLDLRLACLLGQRFGQSEDTTLHLTHQDLARELGTTREVVSRMLKDLEHSGCLRLGRGVIELQSPETLARFTRPPVPAV